MKLAVYLAILISVTLLLVSCSNPSTSTSNKSELTITAMNPTAANPGQSDIEGHIYGTNLVGITNIEMGDGVVIERFSSISSTELYVDFSVIRGASPGAHEVIVVNSNGSAASEKLLTIGDNSLPQASFKVSPASGIKSDPFRFDASASNDVDGSIVQFQWKFGDGTNGNGRIVSHKYKGAGTFKATLTVVDNKNGSNQLTKYVDVAASKPPAARFDVSPSSGIVGESIRFNGSASHDPDGSIKGYQWNFGDGSSGSGATTQHTYLSSGAFRITLTVTDNTGVQGQAGRDIFIAPDNGGGGGGGGGDGGGDGGGGGSGGGTCSGSCEGYDHTQPFHIAAVSGDTITADTDICMCNKGCGEVRRPNTNGGAEFLGDLISLNGRDLTLDHHLVNGYRAPEVGESAYLVFKPCP